MAVTYPIEPGKNVIVGANTVGAPVGDLAYLVYWFNEPDSGTLYARIRVQDPGPFGTHDFDLPGTAITLAP